MPAYIFPSNTIFRLSACILSAGLRDTLSLNSESEKKSFRENFRKKVPHLYTTTLRYLNLLLTHQNLMLLSVQNQHVEVKVQLLVCMHIYSQIFKFPWSSMQIYLKKKTTNNPSQILTTKPTKPTKKPLPHSFSLKSLSMLFAQWQPQTQHPRKTKNEPGRKSEVQTHGKGWGRLSQ